MPTGYTAIIEERDVTFAEFAKRCARAMGGTIHMRDDPMDAPLRLPEQSRFYANRLAEKRAELAVVTAWTDADANEAARVVNVDNAMKYDRDMAQFKACQARYKAMAEQVQAWVPPADCQGLKDFMAQQLGESVRFLFEPELAPNWTGAALKARNIASLTRDIANCREEAAKEIARHAKQVRWLTELCESLGETLA